MRLLVDGMPLHSGGGVQVAIALLEGLRRQGEVDWHGVFPDHVVQRSPDAFPAAERASGRIVVLPKHGPFDLLRARSALGRIERGYAPDLVFTVFGPAYFRPRATHLVGFALPNLVYERDGPLAGASVGTRLSEAVKAALFRRADYLVTETRTVAHLLEQRLAIPTARISVIGNSVNPLLDRYAPTPVQAGEPRGILVPSASYPHKNLRIIPSVAAALRRIAPDSRHVFRLTLDPDSPEWAAIAATAAALGVADGVTTLGERTLEQLAAAYRDASAVFLPTLREASTAVYPEAFHFERPLVTSDLDFARELCGAAALFADPLDADALARALAEILRDAGVRDRLVAAGRERLSRQYPSPARKFDLQMQLIAALARNRGRR